MANLFTKEEIYEFNTKILTDEDNVRFKEFYDRCIVRAKDCSILTHEMMGGNIMEFIAQINAPVWGKVELPTAQQIALVELTIAMTSELFEMMVDELSTKNEKDKLN